MRKIILFSLISIVLIVVSVHLSYYVSKESAECIVEKSSESITPLEGYLVLYVDKEFSPRWVFVGEYVGVLTGSTYIVNVSLLGNVISSPQFRE